MSETRDVRKIPLKEVARRIGVNPNTLTGWDQPEANCRVDLPIAYVLCEYFGVTLNDLFEFVPVTNSNN